MKRRSLIRMSPVPHFLFPTMILLELSTKSGNGAALSIDQAGATFAPVGICYDSTEALGRIWISLFSAGAKTVVLPGPTLTLGEFMNQYGLCLQ